MKYDERSYFELKLYFNATHEEPKITEELTELVTETVSEGNLKEISEESLVSDKKTEGETNEKISSESFRNTITRVAFKWSKLSNVPNEIFTKFPQLEIFDGSHINLQNLNSLSFNKAENLLDVFLNNNNLKNINSYVFVHLKKLETLDLSFNNIQVVHLFAFNGLDSLQSLDLSQNKISNLDDSTFLPLKNLNSIWLDRNRLKVISSYLFTEVNDQLERISMNRNSISVISPKVFDRLKNLQFLHLNGNECISKSFVNHVIQENVSIKMELRSCFKNYRKNFLNEIEEINLELQLKELKNATVVCGAYLLIYNDLIENYESQIEEFEKRG